MAAIALTSASDNPVGECPAYDYDYTVFLPSDIYCNIFYECKNGVPVRKACPPGLHFNPILNVCDYPWIVDCNGSEDDGGLVCYCTTSEQGSGQCVVDGKSGKVCAPSGTDKCWKYNKNCAK